MWDSLIASKILKNDNLLEWVILKNMTLRMFMSAEFLQTFILSSFLCQFF